jgi:hypothetical protein
MFLVVWSETAFDNMNEIVGGNRARKRELAVALRQVAHQLTTDPLGVGESRGDSDKARVMFAGELSVFYSVDTDDNTVRIGNVWLRGV